MRALLWPMARTTLPALNAPIGSTVERGMESNGNSASVGDVLKRWTHLGVTVTLALFLFDQWHNGVVHSAETDTRIAVLGQQIVELRAINAAQDEVVRTAINTQAKRIDNQRSDINLLQQEFVTHYTDDVRRFGRLLR